MLIISFPQSSRVVPSGVNNTVPIPALYTAISHTWVPQGGVERENSRHFFQGMCHSTLIQYTVEPCQYSHQWVQKIWLYQWRGTGAGPNFMTL